MEKPGGSFNIPAPPTAPRLSIKPIRIPTKPGTALGGTFTPKLTENK
jgi:hypothetical protein